MYGSVRGSFRGSPYGFDLCAEGDGGSVEEQGSDCPGWRESSRVWDAAMATFVDEVEPRRDEL